MPKRAGAIAETKPIYFVDKCYPPLLFSSYRAKQL